MAELISLIKFLLANIILGAKNDNLSKNEFWCLGLGKK